MKEEEERKHHTTGSSSSTPWRSVFRSDLFDGQVGLVSGGGTGIGYSIAYELASLGATVIIASRNVETCQQAAHKINFSIGSKSTTSTDGTICSGKVVVGPSTNVRKEDDIKNLIAFIVKKYRKINFLVNNAGGQYISPAEDISRKGFLTVLETNLIGTFLMCREAYTQYMRDNGGGSIVNITIGNRNGMPSLSHSASSRSGVENLTATLSTEWIQSNVRINCVRPGIIFTESGFQNYGPAGDYFLDKILHAVPARRLGSPEEVSSGVVWLLSEGASYVTGMMLCVDGGSSYTALPLVDIDDEANLPVYGTLPPKARL